MVRHNMKIYYLPSPIIKLEKNVIEDAMLLGMFLKVFKATKVVFIYIFIECSGKGDVGLDKDRKD